jgi:hypothetical protein
MVGNRDGHTLHHAAGRVVEIFYDVAPGTAFVADLRHDMRDQPGVANPVPGENVVRGRNHPGPQPRHLPVPARPQPHQRLAERRHGVLRLLNRRENATEPPNAASAYDTIR